LGGFLPDNVYNEHTIWRTAARTQEFERVCDPPRNLTPEELETFLTKLRTALTKSECEKEYTTDVYKVLINERTFSVQDIAKMTSSNRNRYAAISDGAGAGDGFVPTELWAVWNSWGREAYGRNLCRMQQIPSGTLFYLSKKIKDHYLTLNNGDGCMATKMTEDVLNRLKVPEFKLKDIIKMYKPERKAFKPLSYENGAEKGFLPEEIYNDHLMWAADPVTVFDLNGFCNDGGSRKLSPTELQEVIKKTKDHYLTQNYGDDCTATMLSQDIGNRMSGLEFIKQDRDKILSSSRTSMTHLAGGGFLPSSVVSGHGMWQYSGGQRSIMRRCG
jgi:hypothetical protein